MSSPVHTCVTKALIAEGDQRTYGLNWATARRARLKVYEDRLVCGNWVIPYTEFEHAALYSFRSLFFRIPGFLLTIKTETKTYHFGLNGWGPFWKGRLPFDVTREQAKLRLSRFSILIRILLFAVIALYLRNLIRFLL